MNNTVPVLRVFHSDDSIVLVTRGGGQVAMPPVAAVQLTFGLIRGLEALGVHLQLTNAVDDVMGDGGALG